MYYCVEQAANKDTSYVTERNMNNSGFKSDHTKHAVTYGTELLQLRVPTTQPLVDSALSCSHKTSNVQLELVPQQDIHSTDHHIHVVQVQSQGLHQQQMHHIQLQQDNSSLPESRIQIIQVGSQVVQSKSQNITTSISQHILHNSHHPVPQAGVQSQHLPINQVPNITESTQQILPPSNHMMQPNCSSQNVMMQVSTSESANSIDQNSNKVPATRVMSANTNTTSARGRKPPKIYSCDICEKQFKKKFRFTEHRLTHSIEKPYSCDQCESKFTSKFSLQRHVKVFHVTEAPLHCSTCGRTFKNSYSLKRHEDIHKKPFMCDVCGRGFALKNTRDNHALRHSGVRPFACTLCSKTFLAKNKLRSHMKGHTGDIICLVCSKTFSSQVGFSRTSVLFTRLKFCSFMILQ